ELLVVVVRDESAHGHACADVEQRQNSIEHGAADILEIDIDAARTGRREPLAQLRLVPIDADIETELPNGVATLVRAAGDANGSRALQPRDLPNDRAHRAGGCSNDDGFTFFGLTDVEQAHVRSE